MTDNPTAEARRRLRREYGRIYFITDGTAVKIGFSVDVAGRLIALQTSQATELKVLAHFPGSPLHERLIHDRFAHLRVRGEWFQLNPEITAFIAELEGAKYLLASRQATITDALHGNLRRLIMLNNLPAARVAYLKWVSSNPPELGDPKIAAMAERCTCEIDHLVWHRNNPAALFPSIVDGARDKFAELDRLVAEHRAFVGSVCDPVEIIGTRQSSALEQRRG